MTPELRQYGIKQASDHEVQDFKETVYKYLIVLSRHITGRFPNVALLELDFLMI